MPQQDSIKANLLEYSITSFSTGGFGFDRSSSYDSKAIYVPSHSILLLRGESNLILGPLFRMYDVLIGEAAHKHYDEAFRPLLNKGHTKLKEIEVSNDFIDWAISLNKAKNPSKKIEELLI